MTSPARTRRRGRGVGSLGVGRVVAAASALVVAATTLAGCEDEPSVGAFESAPEAVAEPLRYVALGDSFTAAPGVPETSTETFCLRSDSNYPALVADELQAELVDVSCSGATTEHMRTPQAYGGATQPPQFDALSEDVDLVTVGIGGNDLDLFGMLIGECSRLAQADPQGAPCTSWLQQGGGDELLDRVHQIRPRVADVVRGVRERAPEAQVVVVGYPQLVPKQGTCPELPLAAGDYPYARAANLALTRALEDAAAEAGAGYVDLWGPSAGHDICAADPWVNGTGLAPTALPFHPYPEEQQAAAELVLEQVG